MEKAILKTLIYADLFDYPLKINEIHKWLIGKKATIRQLEAAIIRLDKKSKTKNQKEYYFLPRRHKLIEKRLIRQISSKKYFKKAQLVASTLKLIPWIKLVGISGGLALDNADKNDDIDLFIITCKNRLWICRLLALGMLSLIRQRRKKGETGGKIAGKVCANILVEEDRLAQANKDIYVAHEVLQMKVLWQRQGVYSRYLGDNAWALKFLPNWIDKSVESSKYYVLRRKSKNSHNTILDRFENLAKWFQLKIMQQPRGLERIEDGALYFHPKDCRLEVLNKYNKRKGFLGLILARRSSGVIKES